MGVTERGIIQKIIRERRKSCYSKVVYTMKVIKLPFACSEFSVHAQNQRKTGSFVRTKFGFLHNVPFFCTCSKIYGFEMIPLAERTCESGAISNIFEQAIHRFNK